MGDSLHTFKTIADGVKSVTTAGTAVALVSAETLAREVTITARPANTNNISVGASTVVAAAGSQRGYILVPGGSVTLRVRDLADIYIDAVTSGEGVAFLYFND